MGDPVEDLRRYGARLIDSVDPARARAVVDRAMASHPVRRPVWGRRIGALALAAALFVVANVGLALAADGSVPGDRLYRLDRFYERVAGALGFPGAPALERLEEASVLAQRGEVSLALATAAEAIEQAGDGAGLDAARRALSRAAGETAGLAPEVQGSLAVRERAARLLVLAREVVEGARVGQVPMGPAALIAEEALLLAEAASRLADLPPGAGPPPGMVPRLPLPPVGAAPPGGAPAPASP